MCNKRLEMGPFDAETLVDELQEVFASGKTKSIQWRKEQLTGLVKLATERRDEILEALKADLNKPFKEGVREIGLVTASATAALANLEKWTATEKITSSSPLYKQSEIIPERVVLVMAPWNYPFSLSLDPAVGAIAAGNAVAIKPSQTAHATSTLLAKLLPLYVDSTAVRVVLGGSAEKKALLQERWDKIFFTGGPRIGRLVMQAAAKHLTPVILELGGKCPAIVDATADLTVTARRIALGKWSYNNGQTCLSPDYILAEASIVPELVKSLGDTIRQFYGEDPRNSTEISSIINRAQFTRLKDLLLDEATAGNVVYGGSHDESDLYFEPTLILDPPASAPIIQEEVFGPLLAIISVKDINGAIKAVNSQPKPLALYLFTSDQSIVKQVVHETSSGGVTVNDILLHVLNTDLPFGGVGESGMGRYHGKYSFEAFSHYKPVLYHSLDEDSMDRYPSFYT